MQLKSFQFLYGLIFLTLFINNAWSMLTNETSADAIEPPHKIRKITQSPNTTKHQQKVEIKPVSNSTVQNLEIDLPEKPVFSLTISLNLQLPIKFTDYTGLGEKEFWEEVLQNLSEKIKETSRQLVCVDPPCQGFGGGRVGLLKEKLGNNEPTKAALKAFQSIEEEKGRLEYTNSKKAYDKFYNSGGVKLVQILTQVTIANNPFRYLIISEGAQGEPIDSILKKEEQPQDLKVYKREVLKEAVKSIALFHLATFKKIEANKEISEKENAEERMGDDLRLFFEADYFPKGEFNEEIWKWLQDEETKKAIKKHLAGLRGIFKERLSRSDRTITAVHGDYHPKNAFFFNRNFPEEKGPASPRIILIDYDAMGKGPNIPSRDIGRFLGALWIWEAEKRVGSNITLDTRYFSAKKDFILELEKNLTSEYLENFSFKNKKTSQEDFKEEIEFYKFQLFRIIFTKSTHLETKKVLIQMLAPTLQALSLEKRTSTTKKLIIKPTSSQPSILENTQDANSSDEFARKSTSTIKPSSQKLPLFDPFNLATGLTSLSTKLVSFLAYPVLEQQHIIPSLEVEQSTSQTVSVQNINEKKVQEAKWAASHLFQPLITKIKYTNVSDKNNFILKLKSHQENVINILKSKEISEIKGTVRDILTDLSSVKATFKGILEDNDKDEYDKLNLVLQKLQESVQLNSLNSFSDVIISLRNEIYYNILKKKNYISSKKCNDCSKPSIMTENIGCEPIERCWVCGSEQF